MIAINITVLEKIKNIFMNHWRWIFGLTIGFSILISNYLSNFITYFIRLLSGQPMTEKVNFFFKICPKFWFIYLIIIFTSLLGIVQLKVRLEEQFGELRAGHKGTNRFSTEEEIIQSYKAIKYQPDQAEWENNLFSKYAGKSGALIARVGNLALIDTSDSHSITVGRTRGGKDETKVLPDIEIASRSEEQPHLVISTVKYETIEKTKERLEKRGYKIEALNLIDMDYSFGFNCLELIKDAYIRNDIDEAVELCLTFTHPLYFDPTAKDKIWQDTSMALVNACILAMCYEFLRDDLEVKRPELITMSSLVTFLIEMSGTIATEEGKEEKIKLDEYFSKLDVTNPARQQYFGIAVTLGQMRSSIFGSALAKLQKFVSPKMQKMMNRNTFDFKELTQSEQPYAVFILLPDFTQTNYILASTWIEQCYYYLSKYASDHMDRLPKRVRFILNEFGNLPAFTSLSSMISVGAGRGMLFDFYLQDFSQFKMKYGQDIAKFAESQLMNYFYIASSDKETQKKFSEMLGDTEVVQKSRSGKQWSLSRTVSETVERRPLLFYYELANLLEGEWVVIRTKRLSDQYEDVVPYPIYNKGKNRMLKAHEYLDKLFERKSYKEININQHHNELINEADLSYFSQTIQMRIKNQLPSKINNAEIERVEEELEKIHVDKYIEKYNTKEETINEAEFTDQAVPETEAEKEQVMLSETRLYQEVKNMIRSYPKLAEQFEQISNEEELIIFTQNHFNELRISIY